MSATGCTHLAPVRKTATTKRVGLFFVSQNTHSHVQTQVCAFGIYLFVQQTVDNEEEGALLGVENYEEHLEEEISLVQTQNPGAAQYDELGHDLK